MNTTPYQRPLSSGISRRAFLGLVGAGTAGIALTPVAQAAILDLDDPDTQWFDLNDIEAISVSWAAGDVTVVVDDNLAQDAIRVREQANPGFLGLMPPTMKCTMRRSTLAIDYGSTVLGFLPSGSKDLTVALPSALAQQLKTLTVDGASGSYELIDITCTAIDINMASGKLFAHGITVQDFDLDLASGTINIEGRIEGNVDIDAASGTMQVTCREVCPKEIAIDAASGRYTLGLPQNDGFMARIEKLSGSVSIDFETKRQAGNDDIYLYKDGGDCYIDVTLMSGSVAIEQTE